jgi:TonB family protein
MRQTRSGPAAAALAAATLLLRCASAPEPPPAEPAPVPAAETATAATPAEPVSYVVRSARTQLREAPSTKSSVVAKLGKGEKVEGIDEKDGWVRVKLKDSGVGWIRKDLLLKDVPCPADRPPVVLTQPPIRITDGPGSKGRVVVEGTVDVHGKVTSVKVAENPSGSAELADRATSELMSMSFTPAVKNCRTVSFTYVYARTF